MQELTIKPTISTLRRYAVSRSLFAPTSLADALVRLGFVQIDPINAPAPAQDLILRHRARGYSKGDVARAYSELPIEEAYFINHGYMQRDLASALSSSTTPSGKLNAHAEQVQAILAYAQTHAHIRPKALNDELGRKTTANNWGGQGQIGTQLMQYMHSIGQLRIVGREKNQRIYGLPVSTSTPLPLESVFKNALYTLVQTYAPLTHASLVSMCRLLTHGRPDLKPHVKAALDTLHQQFNHAKVDGHKWYWPLSEQMDEVHNANDDKVHLLAPFDPVVWDRARFEAFWGWAYKFEAYKPERERVLGYYAMPMLWGDVCIGWGNVSVLDGVLQASIGYKQPMPKQPAFARALERELNEFARFVGVTNFAYAEI